MRWLTGLGYTMTTLAAALAAGPVLADLEYREDIILTGQGYGDKYELLEVKPAPQADQGSACLAWDPDPAPGGTDLEGSAYCPDPFFKGGDEGPQTRTWTLGEIHLDKQSPDPGITDFGDLAIVFDVAQQACGLVTVRDIALRVWDASGTECFTTRLRAEDRETSYDGCGVGQAGHVFALTPQQVFEANQACPALPGTGRSTYRVGLAASLSGVNNGPDDFSLVQTDLEPAPSIDIEKLTNGQDADEAPGALINEGDPVTWTYVVVNDGNVPLTGVMVEDDVLDEDDIACTKPDPDTGLPVSVAMPTTLEVGETVTCTAEGISTVGPGLDYQYENLGTATGSYEGTTVTDTDPSHYYAIRLQGDNLSIEKLTNGDDADAEPGPYIAVGDEVEWTYVIKNINLANEDACDVSNLNVTDSDLSVEKVVCAKPTDGILEPQESFTCTATGTAEAGQYSNIGTASGTISCGGQPYTNSISDPSHYFGQSPGISLTKITNAVDVSAPPGPFVQIGSPVQWSYRVSNTGNVPLKDIQVIDDQIGDVTSGCPKTTLAVGELMPCRITGTALSVPGQYENTATVQGTPDTPLSGPALTASDTSWYYAYDLADELTIEKLTNGVDADLPPGPNLPVGSTVNWTYVVENAGACPVSNVVVTDSQTGVSVSCPSSDLSPGQTMTCTASGIAELGQYANLGTASGTVCPNEGDTPIPVSSSDPSHYFGFRDDPQIEIEKYTNDEDADSAPGPYVLVGDPVIWRYVVTNTASDGGVILTNVVVDDDQVDISSDDCVPQLPATLEPDESLTCTVTGTAQAGQYENLATAVGSYSLGETRVQVQDSDPSHYFGVDAGIDIEKSTNGQDADEPPGPTLVVGSQVDWQYVVTNTGNVELTNILVTDDRDADVSCPSDTLAVGASMACTATGTAVEGQYSNLGTVTANPPVGGPVSDQDPSHYRGRAAPPGPEPVPALGALGLGIMVLLLAGMARLHRRWR